MNTFIITTPHAIHAASIEALLAPTPVTVWDWFDTDERPDQAVARLQEERRQTSVVIDELGAQNGTMKTRHQKLLKVLHTFVGDLVDDGTLDSDALIIRELQTFGMEAFARDVCFGCDLGSISFEVRASEVPRHLTDDELNESLKAWMVNTLTDEDKLGSLINGSLTDFTLIRDDRGTRGSFEIECEITDVVIDDRRWSVRTIS